MRKLFTLLAVFLMALSVKAGEVTVADGTTKNWNVPITCSYGDEVGTRTQFIYPAEMLESLVGNNLTALKFYTEKAITWSSGAGSVPELAVRMKEVDYLIVNEYAASDDLTEVYSGQPASGSTELFFEFNDAFPYTDGKNLLIEVAVVTKGGYQTLLNFYGNTESDNYGCSRAKYGSNDVKSYFLPKSTISFTSGGGGATCPKPSQLAAAATPDGAVFTWEGENEQYQWCVVEKDAEAAGWALVEAKTYTASGLTAGKEYDFYVRTYCDTESQSKEAKVTFSPFCSAPATVELSDLTHASVKFSWAAVAGIEKYQFVCLRADSTPDWSSVEAQAVLTASIDTLQPQTSYDFYVRSWFNAETQSAATKVSFTTNCVARTLPFSENFDDAAELPICWDATNYGTSGNQWGIGSTWDEFKSEPNSARYNARSSSYTPSDLSTPAVELSENALLKFAYKNAITAEVYIHDGSKETKLLDVPSKSSWTEETIDLSDYTGKIVTIIFRGHANNKSQYFYVDDVQIIAKPCVTPTKVKADASSTGAVVTWTAGSDESEWNLRYRAVGDEDWKEVKEIVEPSYTLTGLASDIEYEVQVQASCSAEKQSAWSTSATFTPQCPVPSALRVSQITDTEALVAWDGTEATYNLQYREKNTEEWTTISAIEGKESLLTDLTGSTRYEVQVQSGCEGAFSSVKTFTTACAPLSNTIPFHEDFEETEEGALPSCWSRRTESEYPMVENTKGAYGVKEDSLAHCLVFRGEGEQVVILPAFDAALNARALSFFYKVSASVTLEIGYLTHLYGTIEVLAELNNTVYEYQEKATEVALKELPEDAKYLVIRYVSTSQWTSSHFDSISIADPSPTAVENTRVEGKASKRIENGVLVLEYNGTIFDATGRKMN